MDFIHYDCGGDIKDRECERCHKKWGLVAFATALDVRPKPISYEDRKKRLVEKPVTTYSSWADSVPFVSAVAKLYPNWPRKWRIISFVLFYGSIGTGIVFWIRSC